MRCQVTCLGDMITDYFISKGENMHIFTTCKIGIWVANVDRIVSPLFWSNISRTRQRRGLDLPCSISPWLRHKCVCCILHWHHPVSPWHWCQSGTCVWSRVFHLDVEERSEELLAPALSCHKKTARRIWSPLLGALERKIPHLYGIISISNQWEQSTDIPRPMRVENSEPASQPQPA